MNNVFDEHAGTAARQHRGRSKSVAAPIVRGAETTALGTAHRGIPRRGVRRLAAQAMRCFVILLIVVSPARAAAPAATCTLPGSNIAGGEFNAAKPSALYAHDYVYPGPDDIALSKRLGFRLMRLPFLWERLQPEPSAALDAAELTRLDAAVDLAASAGMTVVLDAHNYGKYRGRSLAESDAPKDALSDFWKRLAEHYRKRPAVAFGLMNEPNDIGVDAWTALATRALAAIRSTGATNIVLVPGTHWDGAHSWFDGNRSNAEALLPLATNDPNVVFEVHQYFDDNFSGTAESCGGASRVAPALSRLGQWARSNRVRLMLGEFGVSQRPECVKALDDALAVIEHDQAVWWGWTYWAAGSWWGDYPFNIQTAGGDTPQGRVLQKRAAALNEPVCRR